MSAHIDTEKARKTIALVLDKIRTEADPWLLDEYHSLFKKEISLFHRSKVAAYLLMLCDQGKTPHFAKQADFSRAEKNKSRKAGKDKRDASSDSQRYPLADEESKRLFFSVGRSRRVFPREILGLINTKTAIPKEDIGAIRILDNYSFVQVRDTVAEKIIDALNGYMFRGRTLTVNYAKSRNDEAAGEDNSELYNDTGEEEAFGEYTETNELPNDEPQNNESPNDNWPDSEYDQDHTEEEDI